MHQRPKPPAAQIPLRPERDPNAMDIDRQTDSRTCYTCGKSGHIARFCPDQPRKFNVCFWSKEAVDDLMKQIQDFQESQDLDDEQVVEALNSLDDEQVVEALSLDDEQVVEALNELKLKCRYIRGSGNQMNDDVVIKTLDNQTYFKLFHKALCPSHAGLQCRWFLSTVVHMALSLLFWNALSSKISMLMYLWDLIPADLATNFW
ncbi:hypothetical protein B0H13DRAFT_1853417 [Mycena leptocephala]|nr:hypothetical protein B0H13DRAFT_1853417 [Mycena leptocephala]